MHTVQLNQVNRSGGDRRRGRLASAGVSTALAGLLVAVPVHSQETGPAGVPEPSAVSSGVSTEARPILERFNDYYRAQPYLACTAEVALSYPISEETMSLGFSARALRPGQLEVLAFDNIGAFPTSQLVSDGTELFEFSMMREAYMVSGMSPDFDALWDRCLDRSSPNLPVEVFLALFTSEPLQNLLKLEVEPGIIRRAGSEVVRGVPCDVLVVNEGGSRAWIASEGPPRLMRYRNSPRVSRPRYLPPGANVMGLDAVVDFMSWTNADPGEPWGWQVPQRATRRVTLHESAAGPGPEPGYESTEFESDDAEDGSVPAFRAPGPDPGRREPPEGLPPGSDLPEGRLRSEDGSTILLRTLFDGRPGVLVFWIPGGKFTQSSLGPVIEHARRQSGDLSVVPVAPGADPERVRRFTERFPAFEGSYLDPDGSLARSFGTVGVPSVFIVDREGVIVDARVGPTPGLLGVVRDRLSELSHRNPSAPTPTPAGGGEGDPPDGGASSPDVH